MRSVSTVPLVMTRRRRRCTRRDQTPRTSRSLLPVFVPSGLHSVYCPRLCRDTLFQRISFSFPTCHPGTGLHLSFRYPNRVPGDFADEGHSICDITTPLQLDSAQCAPISSGWSIHHTLRVEKKHPNRFSPLPLTGFTPTRPLLRPSSRIKLIAPSVQWMDMNLRRAGVGFWLGARMPGYKAREAHRRRFRPRPLAPCPSSSSGLWLLPQRT